MPESTPLYSPPSFIGREDQLHLFSDVISASRRERWILFLMADGGLGKTKLLEQFALRAAQYASRKEIPFYCTSETIDFYWTKNQRIRGILENIAEQLSPSAFARFLSASPGKQTSALFGSPASAEEADIGLFVECYEQLARDGLVLLLFDTLELCEPWVIDFWTKVLPRLSMNSVVVLAGRPYRDIQAMQLGQSGYRDILRNLPSDKLQELPIDSFHRNLTAKYLEQQGITTSSELVSRLHELSNGKPILLALACDWVQLNGQDLERLTAHGAEAFQTELVKRICELTFGQDQAILAMTHFYRRFDAELMATVLQQDLSWAHQVLNEVSKYSFVKYRSSVSKHSPSTTLLQDEMRRLIDQYVWPVVDPAGEQRRYWSAQVLPYYDMLIDRAENSSEAFALQLEKLHYLMEYNPGDSRTYLVTLLRKRSTAEDDIGVKMVLRETMPYTEQLPQNVLDLISFFREWIKVKTTGEFSTGSEVLLTLDQRKSLDPYEAIQLQHWLVASLAALGKFDRAQEYGQSALEVIEGERALLPKDAPERAQLSIAIGGIYNSLGLVQRRLGNNQLAIKYYDLGLKEDISWAFRATVENNLSYVLLLSGNTRRAERVCRRALNRRVQLGVPNEIALSYNVLGHILSDQVQYHEAYDAFEKASIYFERSGNSRGVALSSFGIGRLMRKWGEHKEHRQLDTFEQIFEQHYRPSIEKLKRARDILAEQDDKFTLNEVLDELGCAYRESRLWQEAEAILLKAFEFYEAEQVKPKMADALQNIAMIYQSQHDWSRAFEIATRVEELARDSSSYYVFSKAKWTLGDVAFAQRDFQRAFREYSQAGVLLSQPSTDSTMYDSRSRELLFENLVEHVRTQILKLESVSDVEAFCNRIAQDWSDSGLMEKEEYKEFVETVKSWPEEYKYASAG